MIKNLLLSGLLCLVTWVAWAQPRTVTGKVTSAEDKAGLPGVSVVVKGTSSGTVTDVEGKYKISVPGDNATLVFSYVGYQTQERALGNQTTVDLELASDSRELNEVVVTAVGIAREKKALGYSVATVNSDRLAQISEPDPLRAMTGKVAGVNIQSSGGAAGGGTNITIRGNSSLSNNNQPLFVVDGVPFDNSSFQTDGGFAGGSTFTNRAFDLDPNNIESMTVLKGAAAAALYGSRAANGAIVITTKTGKKKSRKGLEIAYNTSYATEALARAPEYQTTYGQGTEFDTRLGVFGSWGRAYSQIDSIPHPLSNRFGAVFPELVGRRVRYEPFGQGNYENFYERGYVYENALSVSGGSEKANLTVGISRTDNKGIVPFNNISRTGINIGGNAQLDNGFYVNGSFNYVNTAQVSPQLASSIGAGPSAIEIMPWTPVSYDLTGYPFVNPITGGSIYDRFGVDNPYWSVNYSGLNSKVDRYYGKLTMGFDPLPWLNVQYTAGFNAYTDRRTSYNGRGGEIFPNGNITDDNIYRQELDGTLLVTANRDLGTNWNLRAIVGHNVNQRQTQRQAVFGDGIIVPGINDLDNTRVQLAIGPNQGLIKQRFFAVFADVQLSYKEWGFLNVVARNDWSSTLPAGGRSFFYPGVNGSLVFTEALDLKSDFLSFGKIRAGYTVVGNEASAYQTQTVFNINPSFTSPAPVDTQTPFNGVNTMTLNNRLGSATLRPEFIREFETGLELKLFNNKLGIDFAFYNKIATSQIFTVDIAPSSGSLSRVTNIGKVRNSGIELGVDYTPLKLDNGFSWNINSAFTLNRNLVLDLGGATELQYGATGNASVTSIHVLGQPYGQIRGTVYERDAEGNLLIDALNRTGKAILAERERAIGNPNPNFIWGITNSFSYKGLNLSVLFDWRDGGDMLSISVAEMLSRGVTRDTEDREQVFVPAGVLADPITRRVLTDANGQPRPNNIPISVNEFYFGTGAFSGSQGTADEFRVFDATTYRLREVSLGYSVPANWLKKTPFGSATLSVSGRNLWYFAPGFPKYMNFDPEVSSLGVGNSQGFDLVSVPTTRRFGVNLRVTF
jgi:TonB-linked SusC/RagA family outer membrane protein